MSVISTDSLQLAMVEETVPGTTPATPAFQLWRTTGEGLTFTPNTSESGEIGSGGRFKQPSNVTGMAVSGDINFELAKFPALETAIAAVLGSDWGECPLGGASTFDATRVTAGETLRTFTIEKRFPNPAGGYFYQRFKGVSFSSLTINVSPNNPITGSVGIVGGVPELATTPITGATYVSAGSNPVFTAPEVTDLTVGAALGIGTHCWTSMTLTIDSGNRGIPCIGTQGDREVVLGTVSTTLSGDVYFSDQAVLQALLDNTTIGDGVVAFEDSGNNIYRFDLYGLKPTAGSVAAGGAGQDLVMPLTFEPTPTDVCEDATAGTKWQSGLIVSTVNTAATLP